MSERCTVETRTASIRESEPRRLPPVLVGIMLLAVVLRLLASFYLGESIRGEQQVRVEDQVSYDLLAQSILAGRGYSFEREWYPFTPANTPTAHWSFLYPLYLAGVYAAAGHHPLVARLIQAAVSGVLSTWLLYRLGRRFFGQTVGLVSAGLGALYAYFIFYDAALMTESFFLLGILAMLEISLQLGADARQGGKVVSGPAGLRFSRNRWLWLGIVLGLTALLRQTILLWFPFLMAWIGASSGLWRSIRWWKGAAITLAVIGLLILPWTVRNYIAYRGFLPLNSNAGYAFYSANHPYHGTHFDQDYAADLPPDLEAQGLNEAQLSGALIRRGLEFILQDPARYLLLSANRVGIFFYFWFSGESSLASNLMRVFSYGVYLPFYLFGLALSLRNWRRYSLFYLFALVYTAIHILSWASVRYRLPVDAALMPFAAVAIQHLFRRIRDALPLGRMRLRALQ